MVQADTQLLTYNRGPVAAAATASAEADAVAQFNLRRGLRLSAEARVQAEAHLSAALSSDPNHASLLASVQASLGVSARLALAAQLDVHGLFAEACAAAEARARIQGDIKVTGQMLLDALGTDLAHQGLMAPVAAFLREVQLDAGVYAEAYFAVRARAQLMVTGSVIPLVAEDDHAAFTVAFDYGYAYIWGAGISGFLAVGVPDVPRAVGATVDAAVTEVLRILPADTPAEVDALLRMLVPLSAAAAVAVGKTLGKPQTGEPGPAPTVGDLSRAFLTEFRASALKIVLSEVVETGSRRARELIHDGLAGAALTDELRADGLAACDSARVLLAQLATAESFTDSLPPLLSLCDALAQFYADAEPELPALAEVAEVLTVTAAAAAVLYQVLGEDLGPVLPAALIERVRATTGAGGPVTVIHLVEYAGARIAGLLGGGPFGTTGWLSDVVGGTVPELMTLLWHLLDDPADPKSERKLAAKAITAVTDQIRTHLRPYIDDLPAGDLKTLTSSIDPLLDVLEAALLPLFTDPDQPDPTRASQARDELDTLLTGVFGAMIVRCLNHVISPFFDRGQQQLMELADHVDRHDPVFAQFFALANEFDVVFRITEPIVSAALRETAAMIGIAKESAFAGAIELMHAFVLLPADTTERRAQLAILADTGDPRIGETRLRQELLDALFVKSTQLAVEMVPPSIRMTSLIALDQGPVPLVTLFRDAEKIGHTTVAAINDAAHTVADIGDIVGGIITSGKVSADQLAKLGTDLKAMIGDAADLVEDVLDVVKTLSWPLFVTSTGGAGLFLRRQFDAFFDGADWLVDEIRDRLNYLVDVMVQAMVTVAQDLGVLDSGDGEDLGTLEQAVRQHTLGDPSQPGLNLLDGRVQISHANLATLVMNAATSRDDVREKVRDFHRKAVDQAQRAQRVQLLLAPGAADAKAAEAAMQATLAAQQRDTGFAFHVTVESIENHAERTSGSKMDVVIKGAGLEFVSGPHPQVRVEIGGHSATIDPAGWRIDAQGRLRGQFVVYGDPMLGAPHPFAAEGLLNVAPTIADMAADPAAPRVAPDLTGIQSAELSAIRTVELQHAADMDQTPVGFLTRSVLQNWAMNSDPPTASDFLPPALQDQRFGRRFPAVLELDRPAMVVAAAGSPAAASVIANLPGTRELAFISASQLDTLNDSQAPAALSSLTGSTGVTTLRLSTTAFSATTRSPICVVARVRPGYTTVTATVCAVPRDDQDSTTTPKAQATPDWFVLNDAAEPDPGPKPGPDPNHNDAIFESQDNIPTAMRPGSTQQVSVTMRNTGTTTWTTVDGYQLGAQTPAGNNTWGSPWIDLPDAVPPGQDVTFTFTITAPPLPGGTFQWQMVRNQTGLREWFGSLSEPRDIGVSVNQALFVNQNVPSKIPRLSAATASVTMRNLGTTTWTAAQGYRLGSQSPQDNTTWGTARQELPNEVPPGAETTFSFTIPAPHTPSAMFQWRMLQEGQEWFGEPSTTVQITLSEPVECAAIRATMTQIEHKIAALQKKIKSAPPGEKGAIAEQIRDAEDEIAGQKKQFDTLGCSA